MKSTFPIKQFCWSVWVSALFPALIGYLQVRDLEASNQRLEIQIQRELDRKCPRELRYLDKHLRTVCLLQQRVSGEAGTGWEL